jgi:transcriptional regulator with XRE-family HTH domain
MEWAEGAVSKLYTCIGANIRAARERRNWSQAALASEVGLTRSSIANIEAGRQKLLVHTLVLVGNSLGVAAETLLPAQADIQNLTEPARSAPDLTGHPTSTKQFIRAAIRQAAEGKK